MGGDAGAVAAAATATPTGAGDGAGAATQTSQGGPLSKTEGPAEANNTTSSPNGEAPGPESAVGGQAPLQRIFFHFSEVEGIGREGFAPLRVGDQVCPTTYSSHLPFGEEAQAYTVHCHLNAREPVKMHFRWLRDHLNHSSVTEAL